MMGVGVGGGGAAMGGGLQAGTAQEYCNDEAVQKMKTAMSQA